MTDPVADDYLTLGRASSEWPGRPSTNLLWRWARRGVLGRNGDRIRLEHIRLGGRILIKRAWLEDFGRRLADADRRYFDAKDAAARALPRRDPPYGPPNRRRRAMTPTPADEAQRRARLDEINAELDAAGL